MRFIYFKKQLTILLLFLFFSTAHADLLFSKNVGGVFRNIDAEDIRQSCSDWAFRDQYKDQIPTYLEPDLVKASFTGKLLPSLNQAIKDARQSDGKCLWYIEAEKATLKQ